MLSSSSSTTVVTHATRLILLRRPKLSQVGVQRWAATITAEQKIGFDDAALTAAKPFEAIPSMRKLPYIGTAWIYLPIVGLYDIRKLSEAITDKRRRLGDIFVEKTGNFHIVCTCKPDDVKTLFENEGPYPSRGPTHSLKAYRESRPQWYSTVGIIILQGKEWHDLRSKAQRHLMKPKAIQAFLDPMQDVARDFVENMHITRDIKKEIPEFLGELYKWALESVALVGLDTRLGCLERDMAPDSDGSKMIQSVQTQFSCINTLEPFSGNLQLWKLFPTPTWKKFVAAADVFSEIAFKHINNALEKLKSVDEDKDLTLLQSMLATKGMDVSGTLVMTADMLMAGIDTTSHSVAFFLYLMAKNPEKQEILFQEIKRLLPGKEDRINSETFNELKYLKACMKESHRMLPVVGGTAREIDHDIVLSGYRVPAGTTVFAILQEAYKDSKYFYEPGRFEPERWFQKDEKFHPYAFLPFGVGTRSCIGRRLAELETICVLTEIIKNFKVEYYYEDIGIVTRLINAPDKPLKLTFIER